jgi:hypothetical protein
MPPVGFELTILVIERPQTHALDRTTTGIGFYFFYLPLLMLTWTPCRFLGLLGTIVGVDGDF